MKGLKTLKSTLPTLEPMLNEIPYEKTRERRLHGGRWRALRKKVMERDRYLCKTCERKGVFEPATEIDHKVPLSQCGGDELSNLECICGTCHLEKSNREAASGYTPRRGGSR